MSQSSTQLLANIHSQHNTPYEKKIEAYATAVEETTQPFTADNVWYTCQTTVPNTQNVEASDIEKREADARDTAAAGETTQLFVTKDAWPLSDSCQSTVSNTLRAEIEKEEEVPATAAAAAEAGEIIQLFVTNDACLLSDSCQTIATNEWAIEDRAAIEKREAERREIERNEIEIKENARKESKRKEAEEREVETKLKEAPRAEDITINLTNASRSVPDARLIIASSYCSESNNTDSAIVRLPPTADGKTKYGVIQRPQDVEFMIKLSFKKPSWRSPIELQFQVFYDPSSDNCLLVDETPSSRRRPRFFLSSLSSPSDRTCLNERGISKRIQPGMWRILLASSRRDPEEYPLVDFLLLGRQFSVLIYKAPSAKRAAHDDEGSRKRQKLDKDGAEAIVTHSVNTTTEDSDVTISSRNLTSEHLRETMDKDAIPLLDLADREAAVVQATTTAAAAKYHIRRIKYIGHTKNTSVFTCQHSAVPNEKVAVKVPQYSSKASDYLLVGIANTWSREKKALQKLKHRNIISLKAFDGRLFTLYLELLPSSLFTGLKSTLKLSDAHKILHDMASALKYLAKQRIIHNDIKPFNITYSHGRGAVLIDFGMATSIGERALGGTPWYLPPEILEDGSRGLPGDIWALGITMLYVLGRIELPEKDFQGWMLKDLSKTDKNGKRMMEWLEAIASTRAALDQKNDFENIVFRMLEPKGSLRITAADIVSGLSVLDLNGNTGS